MDRITAVDVVTQALAEDAGWEATEDVAMAAEMAEVSIDALESAGMEFNDGR